MDSINTLSNIQRHEAEESFLSKIPQKQLGQDDFLQLVAKKAMLQNPLKPSDDISFLSEMAQFTALSETRELTQCLHDFIDIQKANTYATNLMQATETYLGKEVTLNKDTPQETKGVVHTVQAGKEGSILITLDNNQYDIRMISETKLPTKNNT